MTVEECYIKISGDYGEAQKRFKSDEKIRKFLLIFLKDGHFAGLCGAMEKEDYEEAFLNAHTLKGMCANLSFSALFEEAKILSDLLRDGKCGEGAPERFEKLKETYVTTKKAIEELCNDE